MQHEYPRAPCSREHVQGKEGQLVLQRLMDVLDRLRVYYRFTNVLC